MEQEQREERCAEKREGEGEKEEDSREWSGRRAFPSSTHPRARQETDPGTLCSSPKNNQRSS